MTRKLEQNDIIDGFELLERLPSGGMASIWRARKPGIDEPLILKVPFLDPGEEVSVIIGYEVEQMISRRLSGPHVPHFYGFGDLREVPYIAMGFVDGQSVADFVKGTPLPPEEVRQIGIQAATALVSLHDQKVSHLDLKPENILLTRRGAVLIDFGLARHAELPDLLGEESSMPMGTAAYIAPEQVLGDRSDPASDIFALGCILYQLATGEEPFGRPQTVAGMRRRLFHPPAEPRSVNTAIPRWLQQIILNCMEVDRSRRYSNAAQLLHDLRHPDQVKLTEPKPTAASAPRSWLARLFRRGSDTPAPGQSRAVEAGGPPIIVAAVFLSGGADALAEEIRLETARLVAARSDSRLACVTVWKTEIIGDQPDTDSEGKSIYVSHLVALKDWARPLGLDEGRVSYHVLEAVSPAEAILEFAARNHAGHIVLGARGSSTMRRHLGSVSTKVVAEALCSVSVIRVKALSQQEADG